MTYADFTNLAQSQDSRNNFQPCNADLSFLPVPLRLFYTTHDPVDVEIVLHDSTSVRFCPMKYLKQIQKEYAIEDSSFIFATQEGDPIYYKPDGIFKSAHGASDTNETKISDNFDSYIEMLLKEMLDKAEVKP